MTWCRHGLGSSPDKGAWHWEHASGLSTTTSSTAATGSNVRVWPGWPGCPPRRRFPRGRLGCCNWGGSLDGGREECRDVWCSCSCNVPTCSCKARTREVKVSTRASSARIEACASEGVRSQTSWHHAGGVSMRTGYTTRRPDRKRQVFTG